MALSSRPYSLVPSIFEISHVNKGGYGAFFLTRGGGLDLASVIPGNSIHCSWWRTGSTRMDWRELPWAPPKPIRQCGLHQCNAVKLSPTWLASAGLAQLGLGRFVLARTPRRLAYHDKANQLRKIG